MTHFAVRLPARTTLNGYYNTVERQLELSIDEKSEHQEDERTKRCQRIGTMPENVQSAMPGTWVRVLSAFYYYYPGGAVVASPLYVVRNLLLFTTTI